MQVCDMAGKGGIAGTVKRLAYTRVKAHLGHTTTRLIAIELYVSAHALMSHGIYLDENIHNVTRRCHNSDTQRRKYRPT